MGYLRGRPRGFESDFLTYLRVVAMKPISCGGLGKFTGRRSTTRVLDGTALEGVVTSLVGLVGFDTLPIAVESCL